MNIFKPEDFTMGGFINERNRGEIAHRANKLLDERLSSDLCCVMDYEESKDTFPDQILINYEATGNQEDCTHKIRYFVEERTYTNDIEEPCGLDHYTIKEISPLMDECPKCSEEL